MKIVLSRNLCNPSQRRRKKHKGNPATRLVDKAASALAEHAIRRTSVDMLSCDKRIQEFCLGLVGIPKTVVLQVLQSVAVQAHNEGTDPSYIRNAQISLAKLIFKLTAHEVSHH